MSIADLFECVRLELDVENRDDLYRGARELAKYPLTNSAGRARLDRIAGWDKGMRARLLNVLLGGWDQALGSPRIVATLAAEQAGNDAAMLDLSDAENLELDKARAKAQRRAVKAHTRARVLTAEHGEHVIDELACLVAGYHLSSAISKAVNTRRAVMRETKRRGRPFDLPLTYLQAAVFRLLADNGLRPARNSRGSVATTIFSLLREVIHPRAADPAGPTRAAARRIEALERLDELFGGYDPPKRLDELFAAPVKRS
jgi:hypothetical protein